MLQTARKSAGYRTGDYASFIEQKLGKSKSGDFISPDGTVCGKHKGLLHYTVGQRKRLGIALGYPVFIKEIDPELNRIYLARTGEEYADGVLLTDCVIQPNPLLGQRQPHRTCQCQGTLQSIRCSGYHYPVGRRNSKG